GGRRARHLRAMTCPVTALAAGEHRKSTTEATCSRSTYFTPSPMSRTFLAVRTDVGAMALARTPLAVSSAAMARMRATTPFLATAYADIFEPPPEAPGNTTCDAKNTIAPFPAPRRG